MRKLVAMVVVLGSLLVPASASAWCYIYNWAGAYPTAHVNLDGTVSIYVADGSSGCFGYFIVNAWASGAISTNGSNVVLSTSIADLRANAGVANQTGFSLTGQGYVDYFGLAQLYWPTNTTTYAMDYPAATTSVSAANSDGQTLALDGTAATSSIYQSLEYWYEYGDSATNLVHSTPHQVAELGGGTADLPVALSTVPGTNVFYRLRTQSGLNVVDTVDAADGGVQSTLMPFPITLDPGSVLRKAYSASRFRGSIELTGTTGAVVAAPTVDTTITLTRQTIANHKLAYKFTTHQSLAAHYDKVVTLPATLPPGTYDLVMKTNAVTPVATATVSIPAPKEGYVDKVYLTAGPIGKKLKSLKYGANRFYTHFHYLYKPSGRIVTVSIKGPGVSFTQKQPAPGNGQTTAPSLYTPGHPLARGTWTVSVASGKKVIAALSFKVK